MYSFAGYPSADEAIAYGLLEQRTAPSSGSFVMEDAHRAHSRRLCARTMAQRLGIAPSAPAVVAAAELRSAVVPLFVGWCAGLPRERPGAAPRSWMQLLVRTRCTWWAIVWVA